jgi:hypothetical protein
MYKYYFGFGSGKVDGYVECNTTKGADLTVAHNYRTWLDAGIAYGIKSAAYAYNVKIRGYKYGLRSALPENTSAVYRLGRYGQFRDMLEQRTYTKFLLNNDGVQSVESPIQVQFTANTTAYTYARDYITASNPGYNPTDTGQFDYEYRSGQPFFDDVDLNSVR